MTVRVSVCRSVTGTGLAAVAAAGIAAVAGAMACSRAIAGSVSGSSVTLFGVSATEQSTAQQSFAAEQSLFRTAIAMAGFSTGIGIEPFSAWPVAGSFSTRISSTAFGTRSTGP
jgi:hypothetical protein